MKESSVSTFEGEYIDTKKHLAWLPCAASMLHGTMYRRTVTLPVNAVWWYCACSTYVLFCVFGMMPLFRVGTRGPDSMLQSMNGGCSNEMLVDERHDELSGLCTMRRCVGQGHDERVLVDVTPFLVPCGRTQ